MTGSSYIPEQGDLVWITLNPQAGHEQSGRWPALVLSPSTYNGRVGLAILAPVTGKRKGYPFEVEIPPRLPVSGVVLSDQVKSLDWRVRNAVFICKLQEQIVSEVLEKLGQLLPAPSPPSRKPAA